MKKIILLIISLLAFSSCAHEIHYTNKEGETKIAQPYGILNPEAKDTSVQYKVSTGNVIWGCILFETIVAPVVIVGWYLYTPITPIVNPKS